MSTPNPSRVNGPHTSALSRRDMLRRCSTGFGLTALSALMADKTMAAGVGATVDPASTRPRPPQFAPRARSVIFCYMSGGASHVDTFDPKPRLVRDHGKPMPMPIERTQFNNNGNLMASPWTFRPRGRCGTQISDLLPHLGSVADELAVIRSMTANFSEHAQGNYFMHTGFPFLGYPSAGAWASYGLGSESDNLPGFVVLRSGGASIPHGGVGLFSSGFLPAVHQASIITADAPEPVPNIKPRGSAPRQRRTLDLIGDLDTRFVDATRRDTQVESAIRNYEMAFRMQSAVPELVDISGESEATKRLYGLDDRDPKKAAYAQQCLLARRLVERGVRFIELSCLSYNIGGGNGPNPWDQHGDLENGHGKMGTQIDQPIAGLIKDLRQRGLLDQTLIVWAGEFGRTPFSQGSKGRDHDPFGFSVFMAGGGTKGGTVYGATDEFGYRATENVCDVYDMWATVLHLLGVDHERLTYRHGGRDLRLTDVHGDVLHDIIA
ncbi:MAG: DUF1501 domain-containing protein [Phycisphaera sp.]|nr:DUF1501 domain-containing protein [Phycisphaera sp.]